MCWIVLAGLALWASQPGELPETARARAAAADLLSESRSLLMKEMAAKEASGALQACSMAALEMAKKYEREGWRVRRVSDRLRNPADAPDSYESAVLADFAARHARGELTAETEHVGLEKVAGRDYVRYLRPILISGAICLKCHGGPEDLAPGVGGRLQSLYPKDKATGYRLNDLRGAVSIRIPAR